jgi:hypothetical protein
MKPRTPASSAALTTRTSPQERRRKNLAKLRADGEASSSWWTPLDERAHLAGRVLIRAGVEQEDVSRDNVAKIIADALDRPGFTTAERDTITTLRLDDFRRLQRIKNTNALQMVIRGNRSPYALERAARAVTAMRRRPLTPATPGQAQSPRPRQRARAGHGRPAAANAPPSDDPDPDSDPEDVDGWTVIARLIDRQRERQRHHAHDELTHRQRRAARRMFVFAGWRPQPLTVRRYQAAWMRARTGAR